jgi:cytochrome bd-type quinol oxidase subunit 2
LTFSPVIKRPSSASGVTIVTASLVICAGLVFGVRDAWVTGAGINGNWFGGALIVVLAVIPIVGVVMCILASRRRDRNASSVLMRAGEVGLAVGIPVLLVLVVGAAY